MVKGHLWYFVRVAPLEKGDEQRSPWATSLSSWWPVQKRFLSQNWNLKSREISFAHTVWASCPIILEFCAEHGSYNAVLCANFQKCLGNYWVTEMAVWTNGISRDFSLRWVSAGGISNILVQQPLWVYRVIIARKSGMWRYGNVCAAKLALQISTSGIYSSLTIALRRRR